MGANSLPKTVSRTAPESSMLTTQLLSHPPTRWLQKSIGIDVWSCIELWDITSLGSVEIVGFFDVAARLCACDGPIAALVGGSSCHEPRY